MRIGIFDSGIGGLSTLLACLRYLPDAHYLFYGDSAHAPYGDKSPAQVRQWTEEAYAWFIAARVEAVVLACNTATSAAVAPPSSLPGPSSWALSAICCLGDWRATWCTS